MSNSKNRRREVRSFGQAGMPTFGLDLDSLLRCRLSALRLGFGIPAQRTVDRRSTVLDIEARLLT